MRKSIVGATCACLAVVSFSANAALTNYSQNFESMTPNQGWPPNDLSNDGWEVFGIAFDANPYTGPANKVYGYGTYPAANGAPGSFQEVVTGQGGPTQGDVVLAKYTDYNNLDQSIYYIAASTFQTQTITSGDAGLWRFTYDAKIANLEADSSAFAYIRTQNSAGSQTAFVTYDTTNIPNTWGTYTLELLVDGTMVGDTLQFGFSATSTNYNGSAVFYDNLQFDRVVVAVPAAVWLFGSGLLGLIGIARRRNLNSWYVEPSI